MPRVTLPNLLIGLLALTVVLLFSQKAGLWGKHDPAEPAPTPVAAAPMPTQGAAAAGEPAAASAAAPPSR